MMTRSSIKKNLSLLVVAEVIGKILPLLTFPYIVRVLGQEVYGKFGFASSITGFFMLLASPGFIPYGIRLAAQTPDQEKKNGAEINGVRILFTVFALALLSVYTLLFSQGDPQVSVLLVLCGLMMVPDALSLDWLFIGRSIVAPVAFAGILGQLAYTGIVLAGVRSPQHYWMIPVATIAGAVLSLAVVYRVAWSRSWLAWPRITQGSFREIVPTSLLLGFASIMSVTYDKVDMIILGYSRPMAEVGLYAATYKLMWGVMCFLPLLSKLFFPLISKSAACVGAADGDSHLYLKILGFAAYPIIFGGILLSVPFTQLILGSQYVGAGSLFSLLLPNVLAGGLASYYAGIKLVAHNRNREYVIAVASGALLNLSLNLVFIPIWGAKAAAVITCLSQFAVAGIAAWFMRHNLGASMLGSSIKPITLSMLMVLSLIGMQAFLPSAHVMIFVGVGASIYTGMWFLLGRHGLLIRYVMR